MSVKTSYYGSIDFTKLLEQAKAGNKAFSKNENGKIYLNVRVYVNDEVDKYGNCASFQSNFKGATKEVMQKAKEAKATLEQIKTKYSVTPEMEQFFINL